MPSPCRRALPAARPWLASLGILLLLAAPGHGCSRAGSGAGAAPAEAEADTPVATVDGRPITRGELLQRAG
ncbi:MAG TPA: hypothetical protein VNM66_08950, partial [Thermodesulfobacteriota bacterium]|nr:hypothetical protein [Thermodesulfobacteriota bacterium]